MLRSEPKQLLFTWMKIVNIRKSTMIETFHVY